MNSNTTNERSSEELRKEVLVQVDRVNADLNEIEERLTPGQIIDDAIFSKKDRSLDRTLDHLKSNPVGTSFLAVGTLMLMEGDTGMTYEAQGKTELEAASKKTKNFIEEKSRSIKSGIERTEMKFKRSMDSLGDSVQDLKDKAGHSVQNLKQKAEDKLSKDDQYESSGIGSSSFKTQDRGVSEKVIDKLSEAKSELKSTAKDMDPTSIIAIGAGLGLLTGASLPLNVKEKRLVDDKLGPELSDFQRDIKEALGSSLDALKDKAISQFKNLSFKS